MRRKPLRSRGELCGRGGSNLKTDRSRIQFAGARNAARQERKKRENENDLDAGKKREVFPEQFR